MTTLSAASGRHIMANAHAAWYAQADKAEAKKLVHAALVQAGYIESYDMVRNVRQEGTTLCVAIDCDDFLEAIEIDAYGNVMRGAE